MDKEDPWRISGAGRLKPRELAYLRSLWYWRDKEAQDWDRPTFMVCGNKQLISWVDDLVKGRMPQLPKHYRTNRRKRFSEAVTEAKELDEALLPQKVKSKGRRVKDEAFDNRVDSMLKKRDSVAAELEIDSSLLISRAVLESMAANEVNAEDVLMNWQQNLLQF